MTDNLKNVINARKMFLKSLSEGSHWQPENYNDSQMYDVYLDHLTQYYIIQRFKVATQQSMDMQTRRRQRLSKTKLRKVERNFILTEVLSRENKLFEDSMLEAEEWQIKKEELKSKKYLLDRIRSGDNSNLLNSTDEDLQKARLSKLISEHNKKAAMLEELCKCFILGVDGIDYLHNDEACNTLLSLSL